MSRIAELRVWSTLRLSSKGSHSLPQPTHGDPNHFGFGLCVNRSGRSAAWLARYLGVVEVVGSNPAGPIR